MKFSVHYISGNNSCHPLINSLSKKQFFIIISTKVTKINFFTKRDTVKSKCKIGKPKCGNEFQGQEVIPVKN